MCSPNGFSPANPGALTSLGIRGTGPNDKLSCYTVSRSTARDEDTPLAERSPGRSMVGRAKSRGRMGTRCVPHLFLRTILTRQ